MADQISSRYVARDFFVYNTVHSLVAAGTSNTQTIQINADSDFQIEKLTFFADIAAAGQTQNSRVIPLATVLLVDTGSGRQFSDQAVPVPSLFGTGEIPFVLKQPKILMARTSLSVTIANFDASNTYTIRLSFIGSKLFLKQ